MRERRSVTAAAKHAIGHPDRAIRYLYRLGRDTVLRMRHRDHLSYYSAVVDADVVSGHATAVGDIESIASRGLTDKRPHLELVRDMSFSSLPDAAFDVIHAHSVFSHTPLAVIEDCFAHVGRLMRPEGFFDLTFKRTEGREYRKLGEDFYFRTETLIAAAERCGLTARFMDDWEQLGHSQSKIRVTRPPDHMRS